MPPAQDTFEKVIPPSDRWEGAGTPSEDIFEKIDPILIRLLNQ